LRLELAMLTAEATNLIDALRRLVQLRLYLYLGLLAVVVGSWTLLDISFSLIPTFSVLALALTLTGQAWLRVRTPAVIGSAEFGVQLLADIVALGVLVFFSGGAYNPFISLLLLPVVMAAGVMPGVWVGAIALAAGVTYSLLMFNYQPLGLPAGPAAFALHLSGMWLDFIVSAGLIAYFLYRLSQALRQRETELVRLREDTLRNEQIIAVASLAAGTAHELGTPLNTLALAVEELAGHGDQDTVRLARNQVARAKAMLAKLSAVARGEAGRMERVELRAWYNDQLENWRWMRPEATLDVRGDIPSGISIQCDDTLGQALLNLLNNAWQVSQQPVELAVEQRDGRVQVAIGDRGPGMTAELKARAGRQAQQGRTGMGLGLMLANSSVERHGGTVHIADREGGGTVVTLSLPVGGE
jgi:two-component system, sensor histidine kinase RegB